MVEIVTSIYFNNNTFQYKKISKFKQAGDNGQEKTILHGA
jgi:hypothetical protein